MASNTEILIKRSFSTATPANLAAGELAYSYTSNNLFIGTPDGTSAIEIGGYKNFTNITPGEYGSTTAIPIIRVSANGLITNVSTAAVSSTLDIAGDTGTDGINLLTDTLTFAGGDGLTSAVTANTVTFNVDDTVFRSNTYTSTQYVFSNVEIAGNLSILGTQTTINVSNLRVEDSLIQLAANNTGDVLDIGFFGHYNDGIQRHTGLVRDANDKQYYLFSGYSIEPTSNNIVPFSDDFVLSTLRANINANTASVIEGLTLEPGSQFYANGASYFANAPYLNSGATANGNLAINSANRIQLRNGDNSATVDVYNSGGAGENRLYANTDIETARNLYVANRIYGDSSNNTLYLVPSTNYAPEVNDQYIIIDPTVPNHIHVRAGGAIDASSAELYLGGEQTNVQVSDTFDSVYIRANNNHVWTFDDAGKLNLPNGNQIYDNVTSIFVQTIREDASPTEILFYNNTTKEISRGTIGDLNPDSLANGSSSLVLYANGDLYNNNGKYLTPTATGTTGGGYSFIGDGGLDTGMFSSGDGQLNFYVNDQLAHSANTSGVYINKDVQLQYGATLRDTSTNGLAFGINAGTISQGTQAVAIGDSAGYNTQGAYGVAIGNGAGNVNQGQVAIAIGLNAGISNQGYNGIAIGGSAGSGQGQYSIALGYDSGGQQGASSIAIGEQASKGNTSAAGINSISIGKLAGFESAAANSIILNASGLNLSSATEGFFVNPIRYTATQDATYDGIAFYNSNTKEIRYSYVLDGGSF